eukprot:CAMPEP_0170172424 /NCGR_PEP_ID=MMETSP0040_2-20121228/5655_1 /TAXON_ID=641309 /ORGANISM="Lotharella oceanica, Strain CCMP622" /LENGTH=71 /DNA_ID=CAMNT_0010413071 /DNA_START=443 /DNA_END=658 /DNA_ORIENTATION=-
MIEAVREWIARERFGVLGWLLLPLHVRVGMLGAPARRARRRGWLGSVAPDQAGGMQSSVGICEPGVALSMV